jgi:hypothetical protein
MDPRDLKAQAANAYAALDELLRDPGADPHEVEAARKRFLEASAALKAAGKLVAEVRHERR